MLTLSAHIHYERHALGIMLCVVNSTVEALPILSLQQLLAVGLVALSTFDFVLYFTLQVTIEGGEQQVY